VIGFISPGSASNSVPGAFRKGLGETGYVEGQNVTVEYHWLEGQFDCLPALMTDLVRRRVAVIATPNSIAASIAAKDVTATIGGGACAAVGSRAAHRPTPARGAPESDHALIEGRRLLSAFCDLQ
jgi:hypothetical protein